MLNGGNDNGIRNTFLQGVIYQMYASDSQESALAWLRAFGCDAVIGDDKESREVYHPIRYPAKFHGLRELWRDGADVIYEVPRRNRSLAHALYAADVVQQPTLAYYLAPLKRYLEAIDNPALPYAEFRWRGPGDATIAADLRRDHLISVEVTWDRGWKARVNGEPRRIWADTLGQMVVEPRCSGPCTVDLSYDGGSEMMLARIVSWLALAGGAIWILRSSAINEAQYNNEEMTAATPDVKPRYQFKPGPHSSHTLLLAQFPERGEGRPVLDLGCAAGYLSEILAERGFSVACIDWPGTPHPATVEFSGADLDDGLGPVDTLLRLHHLRRYPRAPARSLAAVEGVPGAPRRREARWWHPCPTAPTGISAGTSSWAAFRNTSAASSTAPICTFTPGTDGSDLFERAGFRIETVRSSAVPFGLAVPAWDGSVLSALAGEPVGSMRADPEDPVRVPVHRLGARPVMQ